MTNKMGSGFSLEEFHWNIVSFATEVDQFDPKKHEKGIPNIFQRSLELLSIYDKNRNAIPFDIIDRLETTIRKVRTFSSDGEHVQAIDGLASRVLPNWNVWRTVEEASHLPSTTTTTISSPPPSLPSFLSTPAAGSLASSQLEEDLKLAMRLQQEEDYVAAQERQHRAPVWPSITDIARVPTPPNSGAPSLLEEDTPPPSALEVACQGMIVMKKSPEEMMAENLSVSFELVKNLAEILSLSQSSIMDQLVQINNDFNKSLKLDDVLKVALHDKQPPLAVKGMLITQAKRIGVSLELFLEGLLVEWGI
jgi:hypothetical protein